MTKDPEQFIRENLAGVQERMDRAARAAGMDPADVTLVAVSKTHPPESLETAHKAGAVHFGESYAQEAVDKIDKLDLPVKWHFIGHLQRNKVHPVVERFDMIQSVDSTELLKKIDRVAGRQDKQIEVLLQVNLTGEQNKFGLDPDQLNDTLQVGADLKNVKIQGLMLLPPFYDDPEKNRGNFAALRRLAGEIDQRGYPNWENKFLSMGMTDDFEVAISEGSNMIRVGRAIFGARRRK